MRVKTKCNEIREERLNVMKQKVFNTYPIGLSHKQILVGRDNIKILCKFQHLKHCGLFII